MEITSTIVACRNKYRISHLTVNGQYICDVIEDRDRGLTQDMPLSDIKRIKVMHETAIPRGRYEVTLNITSPKFDQKAYYHTFCKGKLPRLLNVPGFDGILIHRGVNQNSSSGCLIVGYNTVVGQVTNSQRAFETLYRILKEASDRKERIYITIK